MERLERKLDDHIASNRQTNKELFQRLGDAEKNNVVKDEKYNHILDLIEDMKAENKTARENQKNEIEKLSNKLDELINKPSKRWDSIISTCIATFVSCFVAYFMIKLGIK